MTTCALSKRITCGHHFTKQKLIGPTLHTISQKFKAYRIKKRWSFFERRVHDCTERRFFVAGKIQFKIGVHRIVEISKLRTHQRFNFPFVGNDGNVGAHRPGINHRIKKRWDH